MMLNNIFGKDHAHANGAAMTAKVYTTPTCPYCTMAKRYLTQKGVKVEEVDVSRDQRAAMEMVQRTGQMGVPVVEMAGQMIVGFDRQRIDALLKSA